MPACTVCKEDKSTDSFSASGLRKRRCRECVRAYARKYYAAHSRELIAQTNAWKRAHPDARQQIVRRYIARNPSRRHRSLLKSTLQTRYGLAIEDYELAVSRAGGVCEICGGKCRTGQRLSVDHDHATGSLRGLLCRRCNAGLGHFDDQPDRLARAVAYLNRGGVFINKEAVA